MELILTTCESLGQEKIWALTKALWGKKNLEWYHPVLGTILGAPLAEFKTAQGKIMPGKAGYTK